MEIRITPQPCWFVEGSQEYEENLENWKRTHPEFIEWTQEWFEKEFVETGELLFYDSDSYGGGGTLLLFKTQAAAQKYGQRDAALASGSRFPLSALYVDLSQVFGDLTEAFEDINDGAIVDSLNDIFWDATSSDAGLAGFHESRIAVFENGEKGLAAIKRLEDRLRNLYSDFAAFIDEDD
jgi:hypothetical protein